MLGQEQRRCDVYCWGGNEDLALGIGVPGGVNVPTPVLRPDEGG